MERRTYARRECACNSCMNNAIHRHPSSANSNCICQKQLNESLIGLVRQNNRNQFHTGSHDYKPKKKKSSTTTAKATLITVSKKSLEKLIEIHVKDKIDNAVQASVNKITSDMQHRITLQESRLLKLESSINTLKNSVYELSLGSNFQNNNNINTLFPTVESSRLSTSAPSKAFQTGFDEFKSAVLEAIKGVDKKHQNNFDEHKSLIQSIQNQLKNQTINPSNPAINSSTSITNRLAAMREQNAYLNETESDTLKETSMNNSFRSTDDTNTKVNMTTYMDQQNFESDFRNAIIKELKRQSEINQGIETTLQFHDNDIKLLKELMNTDVSGTIPIAGTSSTSGSNSSRRTAQIMKGGETADIGLENKYKSIQSKLRRIGDSTSQACQAMANRLDSIESSTLSLLSFAERSSDAFRILSDGLNLDESVVPRLYTPSTFTGAPSSATVSTSSKAADIKSNIKVQDQGQDEDESPQDKTSEYETESEDDEDLIQNESTA